MSVLDQSDDIVFLREENNRLREALEPFVAYFEERRNFYSKRYRDRELGYSKFDKMPDHWPMEHMTLNMGRFRRAVSAFKGEMVARKPRPCVDGEMAILKRLADGDTIVFSQDGDMAWFTKGDRAFVGNAIMSLREKGYLLRQCDDDENYRGLSEYDTISEAGRAAIAVPDIG